MLQAGGTHSSIRHLLPLLCRTTTLLDLVAGADAGSSIFGSNSNSQHHQQQQLRGAAKKAAKKLQATSKGKKGQQQSAKKQKLKMETKPFDDKDPLMQKLIAMLVPAAEPVQRSAQEQLEVNARAKEFSRQRMREHMAWKQDLNTKLALKKAALQALPPELRKAALEEDLAAFPLTRNFLYDSPPDSYRD